MPDLPALALTHADTRDFLRGVSVVVYEDSYAEELLRTLFRGAQARQVAFVALADCGLELVPLDHH